ncbi:carbonic anhydrase [Dendrothele bispora CBS 962.96]|uniref:Carbonic anhydrase n=1 Tax=Dendrothele bispora (strain CBS 962.96) TaxID=1314807 RepID=A0A4V4HH24_DENBC|nr:carbonic anhydrase [Dendrothele bispora CBS 962.96]
MPPYPTTAPVPSQELLDRNAKYASESHKPKLGQAHWGNIPHHAVVTCMDSRINPHEQLGLGINDTAVIRNAGGGVAEILPTILAAQKFGVRHFMLLKHTDCGGFHLTGTEIVEHFKAHAKDSGVLDRYSTESESESNSEPGGDLYLKELKGVKDKVKEFGFGTATIEEIVLRDVEFLKEKSGLMFEETEVSGWVLDDETGKIRQIV